MKALYAEARVVRSLATAFVLSLVILPIGSPRATAATHAQIQGDGSSWAQNALNQWVSDVQQDGLQVVYTGVGSAQGRQDFSNGTVDFADSDIGYQGHDPVTGSVDSSSRPYAYVPVVAGGTAFPYQIRVAGKLVTNLRLSGVTVAKIFTNQITNWDDPEITADNNGHALPSLPIIPVVHSEGAGSTAQFTQYLATEYPQIWSKFAGYSSFTEYFPRQGGQISQNGSDSVISTVTSAAGNGSIGYDEYSYALAAGFPVAKVENTAGYFTAPTQYNVAVALTQAQINMDKSSPNYLLQNLTNVYSYNDPRTYPLSSYSYGIIPTSSTDATMTTAKRQTLADFLFYATCQGQAEMGPIGYSPLPVNLVEASFQQVDLLNQADPNVDVTNENVQSCHNPTFVAGDPSQNYLAEIAPQPPACDKAGQGPCGANEGIILGNPTGGQAPSSSPGNAASSSGGSESSSVSSRSSANGPVGGSSSASVATGAGSSGSQLPAQAADSSSGNQVQASYVPAPTPSILAASLGTASDQLFASFAAIVLLLVVAFPPVRMILRRRADRVVK